MSQHILQLIKLIKITSLVLLFITASVRATEQSVDIDQQVKERQEYSTNYGENGGNLLFKVHAAYSLFASRLATPNRDDQTTTKNLVKAGSGLDVAVTYFFGDHIAAELSAGLNVIKIKQSALKDIATSLGKNPNLVPKTDIYHIPVTATLQYYILSQGTIRPYIGGGYHGSYMHSTHSKQIKVSHGHGPVAQIGANLLLNDHVFITADLKQYWLKSNVSFKENAMSATRRIPNGDLQSKFDWSPMVCSIGVGFNF